METKKKLFAEDVMYIFIFFNLIGVIHFFASLKDSIAFPLILIFWEGVCAWYLIKKLKRRKFTKKEILEILGLHKISFKEVLTAIPFILLILCCIFLGIHDLIASWFPMLSYHFPEPTIDLAWLPIIIILVIAAVVVEEITYRAYFMNTFRPRPAVMIGVSVILFTAAHWFAGTTGIISAAIIGIFLSIQFLITKSSFSTMITHLAIDLALLGPLMVSLAKGVIV